MNKRGTNSELKKIRISLSHQCLSLPRTVFYSVVIPQNFHHRNSLHAKLTSMLIHYRHWIFFIRQILTKFQCLRLKNVRRIRYIYFHNIFPHVVHIWHTQFSAQTQRALIFKDQTSRLILLHFT